MSDSEGGSSDREHGKAQDTRHEALPPVPVTLSVAVVLIIVVIGYLLLAQQRDLQDRMTKLSDRMVEVTSGTARASARSEAAVLMAARAAQNAGEAVEQRDQAARQLTAAKEEIDLERARTKKAQQRAKEASLEADRIRSGRKEELDRLQEALGLITETRRTALGLVMNLGNDSITFEFDRAELHAEDRELLARIAGVLITSSGYQVQVFGHTDAVGSEEYNLDLSLRRAQAVHNYLAESGINPDIITLQGFGNSKPLVNENNEAARKRNRRVEIGIIDVVVDFKSTGQSRDP